MVVDTIGLKKSRVLLKVLIDPGSTKTLISRKALPRGTRPIPLQQAKMVTTLVGTMKAAEMVHLRDLRLIYDYPNSIKTDESMNRKRLFLKTNADMTSC